MMTTRCFTQEKIKCLTNIEHKSAITDHADRHNREGTNVVDKVCMLA